MAEQNEEAKNAMLKSRDKGGTSSMTPGTSSSMSVRLPSFRGPRDLTLSASASPPIKPTLITRNRKTFSPNIPVRREKTEKVVESKAEKSQKRNRDRDKKEGGRGRGRGRGKEFVQTTGSLFGEGIAATPQRRAGGGYGFGWGGGGGGGGTGKAGDAGFLHKPVLNLDSINNIDKDHEDQKLKDLLRDNFIDDPNELSERDSDEDLFPVQLPMVDTGRGFKEEDLDQDVKVKKPEPVITPDGTEVKSEPADPEEAMAVENDTAAALETKDIKHVDKKVMKGGLPAKEKTPEPSVVQLLSGKHRDFMFFQLPNSLPSHPPEIKQEPQTPQQKQSQPNNVNSATGDDDEEKKSQPQYCTLNTLPEGQIGSLKIYKSGKTELWLGDHKLIVNKGTQVGFLQDVVSVETDEEKKSGNMTVLGHIGHRLVCSPDLESLVRQMKT
ncbi:DNA-directed RNA polymerase III subunit RPC4-like isoform X2 [Penaeus japonicus]|uniref:DNA-directed RNA polymerase III subunit RPC4-like isoform X2 n=1 Tax=Penaeus japonicus TaxID=27405 RepID=UPI001C714CDD|nr:DNA-directed RNA polymerase III subunit RPC4-like isoform X2 [Penaeus japonicus]